MMAEHFKMIIYVITYNQFEQRIQMSEENLETITNESNLLESMPTLPISTISYDDLPIGSGPKNTFSEYPSENDPPRQTKKMAKKPVKPAKKQIQSKENVNAPTMKNEEIGNTAGVPLEQMPVGGNLRTNFDEKPIGKNNFNISEFPEGQQQPAENNTQYTMSQKLKSKAAKMRVSGMEDLLKKLEESPDDPELQEVSLLGLLKESTPASLQKSLMCLKSWMDHGRVWGEQEVRLAIQNGFINGKTNTRKLTIQAADQMYEQKPAIVQMVILAGFKSKTPKIIAGYIGILVELLAIYGVRRLKYLKPYYSQIVRVMTNQKFPAIKTEGFNVLRQSYKWMGKEVVQPMIAALKEAIRKELDVFWDSYDKSIVMTAPKDFPEEGGQKMKGKKIDAYDLSQAVDIFKKFNDKWAESVLKAEKWNQKTKLMEEFVKAASVPKLANTDHRHVAEVIRRLINDSNFNVVLWDLRMLGVLSKGLRRHFSPIVKSLFSNVIGKFRDKKTQMIDETFTTLGDLLYSISFEDVLDDIKEGLNDKAPNMRVNVLNWITKCVEQKAEQKGQLPEKTKDAIKSLFPIFQKLIADGVADVRECIAKNIGKLKLTLGDQFFYALESKMNKNLASKVVVDPKQQKSSLKDIKKNDKHDKSNEDLSKSTLSSKGPIKPDPKARTVDKREQKVEKIEKKEELQCYEQPGFEESLNQLLLLGFPENEVKNITAAGAKQRGGILNVMRQNPYQNLNCVLRVIRKAYRDWKEVNLMMNKDFVAFLEERNQDINKEQTYVLIPFIVQKISDSKFSDSLFRTIASICCRVSARFFSGHVIKYVHSTEGKKPKLNGDACTLLIKIIENVSISNLNLRELVEYAKETYAISFSRKGAIELFNCLYSYAGEQIKPLLDEATGKALQMEFKQIKPLNQQAKRPRVQFEGDLAMQNKVKKPVKVEESKIKSDLTGEVQRLLPKMNDNGNWQHRKDAAQLLASLIQDSQGRVSIGCMGDLLATLKNRINDPNKQLIKVFVNLTGLVFGCLGEKDLKMHARSFVAALVQGLSDKGEVNRREIHLALNRIGDSVGKEQLLSWVGSSLEGQKELRLEVLQLILNNEDYLPRTDLRDYPKGIVGCLCDKNTHIRAAAEKLFERVHDKLGLEVFRSIAKDQRPAVAKDLNNLLDKFDKNNLSSSGFTSKGVSPSKAGEKVERQRQTTKRMTVQQPPPLSGKKRSLSKTNTQKSFIEGEEQATGTPSYFGKAKNPLVVGDQWLAGVKILAGERAQRQQNQQLYVWRFDEIRQVQQQELRDQIMRLVRVDLGKKILSFDYRRVLEAVIQLIKLCKDLTYQGHIREIYDVLLKWVLLRLWGGSPSLLNIIEVVPPIMSILQKKKMALNEFEVDLVIAIIRQYLVSAYVNGLKVSESLYAILKCLIALSSGEKVLKRILRQFSVELSSIHRHLSREACAFYRDGLSKLVKTQLMEYVGNQDTLEEASRIKELKNDPEFVEMLYRRFHENVLTCFGFRQAQQTSISPIPQPPIQLPPNQNQPYHVIQRDRSADRLPPRGHQSTATMGELSRPNNPPSQSQQPRRSTQPPVIPVPSQSVIVAPPQILPDLSKAKTLDLSIYPAPHPASPMAKQLGKLLPPNQSTISFFNSLFVESGEKIANQLSSNAKIIFGSILKSVQELLDRRSDYSPQKIVAQIKLLQNCIKCGHIMRGVGQLLEFATGFALGQLVYEDEHKAAIYEDLRARNIDYKIQNFIKAINAVMLRLLQFGHSQDIVNILLSLLIQHTRAQPQSPKTISLIIKCLGRVAPNFAKDLKPQGTRQFFLRANEYLGTIGYSVALEELEVRQNERLRQQDNAANAIKSILVELCKALGPEVWEQFERAMSQARFPDQHISTYIASLNIRYPERPRQRSQQKQNEELKRINELLSKNKSFESGVAQLKKYLVQHPEFSPVEYFTSLNYDQKFIAMVVASLDGPVQRRTPLKDARDERTPVNRLPDPSAQTGENIQDKIKKLKQKFQELQPETPPESSHNSVNRGGKGGQQQEQREERAQQIRRRIDQMKNKMNSAVRPRP